MEHFVTLQSRGDRSSWLGGAEDDESLKIFGRPEGVHSEAGQRRRAGRGDLSQGRD
jgi:hypothetical protein